jgi:succinate dehydrogenase / fumarate reductase cytochrome b subunit
VGAWAAHRIAAVPATAQLDASVREERRGRWLREVWASTIGKKIIVATTGVVLGIYLILHVLGNLKAIQGPGGGDGAAVDVYASWLRTVGGPAIPHEGALWTVRAILILALVIHVTGVLQLNQRNREARATRGTTPRLGRTWSSRTMMLTGVLIAAFLVFHILQFTTRTVQVTPVYEGTVYANLYAAFQEWYFALLYIGAGLIVLFHLRHAIWSVAQTMGWDKPNRNTTIRRFATGMALFVGLGFALIPLLFWIGALPEPS